MTERERQVRLHVTNRLEELRAKYGDVDETLPPWLDTLEGYMATRRQAPAQEAEKLHTEEQAPAEPPPPRPAPRRSQRVWERP